MFDDLKTKGQLKKIEEGGTGELSRSQIVVGLVNLRAIFKPMKTDDLKKMPEEDKKRANAIVDWYRALRKDRTKEVYDKEKLDAVSKELLDELEELKGPSKEEIEAELEEESKKDKDVKAAEDIDMDNFFGDDE